MRIVADRAVLLDRWMLVDEWPLLLRMAFVADQVDGLVLEVPFRLAVRIMAVGTGHLAFPDRVVGGHQRPPPDFRMALVARLWLIDRHRQPLRALHGGMAHIDQLRDAAARVWVMTVCASHAYLVVS